MKNVILLLVMVCTFNAFGQNVIRAGETDWPNSIEEEQNSQIALKTNQIMSCAASTIFTTGYPAWTNYYAGYMFKVNNTSTCNIVINCFEARFQGTSGYRIYTKTGTFIGFEGLPGSWTLVGTAANVTGISTVTCSPIPIAVNVTIPPASSQSFYLTRTDNLVANRHLYVTGAGTAGTTVYASDANVQITEAEYLDTYFLLQAGVRRPSFDMYYDKVCGVLPIELTKFEVVKKKENLNMISWTTASEKNNDYFSVEKSPDAINFIEIKKITGAGNSIQNVDYSILDDSPKNGINYYRLKQVDFNGQFKYSNIAYSTNTIYENRYIRIVNYLGQDVGDNYVGIVFLFYSNGTVIKKVNN